MTDSGAIIKQQIQRIRSLSFLRGRLVRVFSWPIVCLALGIILWSVTVSKIEADKRALNEIALKQVAALSHAYAQYLTGVIEQVDQITRQIKYNWEDSHGKLDLEDLSQKGIFRSPSIVRVSIIDHNGLPITSTDADLARRQASQKNRSYFLFHKNDKSDVLLFGKPVRDSITNTAVIEFTRRLDTTDGSFAGVALICIESDYLTAFYAGNNPGKSGLLAVVGNDGSLRAAKIGGGTQKTVTPALNAIPLFNSPEGSGFLQGELWFSDKKARFVAWESLQDQPITVIAGLTEDEFLGSYQEIWDTYQHMAIAGSILLLLLSLVATVLSTRLARKKHQQVEARKQAEAALRESARLLDSVIENLPVMLFLKRASDLRTVMFNKAGENMLGFSRNDLLGKNNHDFFPKEQADFFTLKERHVLNVSGIEDIPEEVIATKDGGKLVLHTVKMALRDENGKPQYLLGISEDITDRKRAEAEIILAKDEAEKANRIKSEFLSHMSHELRTPLNAIIGFTQLIEMDALKSEDESTLDNVHDVLTAGQHLLALVNDVLDFAQLGSGKLRIEPSQTNLLMTAIDGIGAVRTLAEKRKIEMRLINKLLEHHGEIWADPLRTKQVLLNLLSNAIKYNKEGGSIEVALETLNPEFVRLTVKDTGIGIPEERFCELFLPFKRLHENSTFAEGAGIGLSITKDLVEMMGGRIGAKSVSGEGTTFWIDMPAYIENANAY